MVPSKYIPKLRIKILYPIQNLRHLAFNEKGVCYSTCNFGPLLQAANISCLMTLIGATSTCLNFLIIQIISRKI
jgi:hypothetical protein